MSAGKNGSLLRCGRGLVPSLPTVGNNGVAAPAGGSLRLSGLRARSTPAHPFAARSEERSPLCVRGRCFEGPGHSERASGGRASEASLDLSIGHISTTGLFLRS